MAGNNKMLIDATHPEETRVAVVKGNKVEEFDFESQDKHQIRGNIYLAKVTRVEPSLQAAFIEYGGNRHGFLAFSEIHPDYYQIPLADREALLQEELEEQQNEADEDEAIATDQHKRDTKTVSQASDIQSNQVHEDVDTEESDNEESNDLIHPDNETNALEDAENDDSDIELTAEGEEDSFEDLGQDDVMEEVPIRRKRQRKQYKIQEVIKRRQILLVQVAKEERGNKGAALTTYLSLAGRYCVLMPNTPRGGGISRKITHSTDRKRLKEIAAQMAVPQGMGVIIRTAGATRTEVEIKRDFEYLSRLWENVRNLTLESSAPCLVYEEGSLIKRSIRDLYNKDIGEVSVAGENGYREAKDFMRMLMPSHAKSVKPYRDTTPLFARFGIENQLDGMMKPEVTLKSGGYIVINQTEALVAIDVNSGRSTNQASIEETALNTNLEAAEEIARQLRLRDLAGLIVIDFIDMEERRNNRSVEKKLKDCLKNDRARIQLGRISHFGLMEMSRQRLRASVLDSTTHMCSHCSGTGLVRSDATLALQIIRAIEENMLRGGNHDVAVRAHNNIALFLLNHKRESLTELENRYGKLIVIVADPALEAQKYEIEKGETTQIRNRPTAKPSIQPDSVLLADEEDARIDAELQAKANAAEGAESSQISEETPNSDSENQNGHKRRRRRRKRRNNDEGVGETSVDGQDIETAEGNAETQNDNEVQVDGDDEKPNGRRRRRGRRGGRRNRNETNDANVNNEANDAANEQNSPEIASQTQESGDPVESQPKRKRTTRRKKTDETKVVTDVTPQETQQEAQADKEVLPRVEASTVEKPKRKRRTKKQIEEDKKAAEDAKINSDPDSEKASEQPSENLATSEQNDEAPAKRSTTRRNSRKPAAAVASAETTVAESVDLEEKTEDKPTKKRKGGWWQRRVGFF